MRDKDYQRLLGSRTWKTLRGIYLGAHPLCEDCLKQGKTVVATECHHVVPIDTERTYEGKRRLAYDDKNLAALCPDCHRKRHEELDSHNHKKIVLRSLRKAHAFLADWLSQEGGE